MPWIVGIDEAGYGPNLGPLVMTSVACRVPEGLTGACLWEVLRSAVRRHPEADDGRPLVDDSKLVYSTTRGLRDLETAVLALLSPWRKGGAGSLRHYLDWACPPSVSELSREAWYDGTTAVPVVAEAAVYAQAAERFDGACRQAELVWGLVRSVVVCAPRFNAMLDQWGSKGAVLAQGLTELLQVNCGPADDEETVLVFVDKHGGRNTYAAMLQNALTEGVVVAEEEGMNRSAYRVLGLKRELRFSFQPRADAAHLCVALASMLSKYLREVLMLEFNRFWQAHVPGLKATAGYPGDAARFFDAIQPALQRLGLPEEAVWRRK